MGKITVIGAGSVGAAVANDLMVQGIASEILLVDVNKKKAKGEALDIYQGAPFHSPAVVRSGDYADAAGSNIVVITCGIARKPGMTRLDLAKTNVNIIKEVAKAIVPFAPDAKYGEGTLELQIRDSYFNMKKCIEPCMFVVERAMKAMEAVGMTPKTVPIRGGTDGARLSYEGLPCPNLCTGGENFHGRFEFIPVEDMEKVVDLLTAILTNF